MKIRTFSGRNKTLSKVRQRNRLGVNEVTVFRKKKKKMYLTRM